MMPFNPGSCCCLLYLSAWLIAFPFPAPDQTPLQASKTAPPGMGTVLTIGKPRLPKSAPPETALPGCFSGMWFGSLYCFLLLLCFPVLSLLSLPIKTNAA